MLGVLVAIKTVEVARKARQYADPNGPHADMVNSAKAKVGQCRDGVAHCIDGAGKFADEQTGGKYTDKITSGVGIAKNLLGGDYSAGGGAGVGRCGGRGGRSDRRVGESAALGWAGRIVRPGSAPESELGLGARPCAGRGWLAVRAADPDLREVRENRRRGGSTPMVSSRPARLSARLGSATAASYSYSHLIAVAVFGARLVSPAGA